MKVHHIQPFALDKNLGRAYNEAMRLIPEGDWACIRDIDTLFLTHDAGNIVHEYAVRNPNAGILTCKTNRISTLSPGQLLNGKISEDANMRNHIKLAEKQREQLYKTEPIERVISGFLMMISKDTWNKIKFVENRKCLVVDNIFSRTVLDHNKSILCMSGLYLWHSYRLLTGIFNKQHLL